MFSLAGAGWFRPVWIVLLEGGRNGRGDEGGGGEEEGGGRPPSRHRRCGERRKNERGAVRA